MVMINLSPEVMNMKSNAKNKYVIKATRSIHLTWLGFNKK